MLGLGKTVDNGGEPLTILQDISFSVMPGETVAIVGASGSGKSTLLGLLAGLDEPSSGEVCLDGETLNALSEDQRARLRGRLLGFVFQSFQLLPSLTAVENVMLPLELAGVAKGSELARAWLERVGLDDQEMLGASRIGAQRGVGGTAAHRGRRGPVVQFAAMAGITGSGVHAVLHKAKIRDRLP